MEKIINSIKEIMVNRFKEVGEKLNYEGLKEMMKYNYLSYHVVKSEFFNNGGKIIKIDAMDNEDIQTYELDVEDFLRDTFDMCADTILNYSCCCESECETLINILGLYVSTTNFLCNNYGNIKPDSDVLAYAVDTIEDYYNRGRKKQPYIVVVEDNVVNKVQCVKDFKTLVKEIKALKSEKSIVPVYSIPNDLKYVKIGDWKRVVMGIEPKKLEDDLVDVFGCDRVDCIPF